MEEGAEGRKEPEVQGVSHEAVRLYVLGMLQPASIESHQPDCVNVSKEDTTKHTKVDGGERGEPTRSHPYRKNCG